MALKRARCFLPDPCPSGIGNRGKIVGAVHQVLRGSYEPRHFLLAQYCGQPPLTLGKRNVIGKIWPSECLDEEKTQSSGTTFDRSWRKLAVAKQVNNDAMLRLYSPGVSSDGSAIL